MTYVLHTDLEAFFEGLEDRVIRVQPQLIRERLDPAGERLTSVITLTAQELTGILRATRVVVEVISARCEMPQEIISAARGRAGTALDLIERYAFDVIRVREIGEGILSAPGLLEDLNQIVTMQHLWTVRGSKHSQREIVPLVRERRRGSAAAESEEFDATDVTETAETYPM